MKAAATRIKTPRRETVARRPAEGDGCAPAADLRRGVGDVRA